MSKPPVEKNQKPTPHGHHPGPTPPPGPPPVLVYTKRLFAPGNFWDTPLSPNPPLHPNSDAFAFELVRQYQTYYQSIGFNTSQYCAPVYLASPNTPRVKVTQWNAFDPGQNLALQEQWLSVPIPTWAEPADGTDQEMALYDPSRDTYYEFWLMRKDAAGAWSAAWGGAMSNASQNPGIWTGNFGTTATSLPFVGGQITAEELQAGQINHVIGIALHDTEDWPIWSWPATRSDGWNQNPVELNRIPEGLRFRLDPAVNVDLLPIHPIAKTVARAGQKYGFVVWDKAGAISLRCLNQKSYTKVGLPNPYITLLGSTPDYAVMNGFPLDRMQFLPFDYGKP